MELAIEMTFELVVLVREDVVTTSCTWSFIKGKIGWVLYSFEY